LGAAPLCTIHSGTVKNTLFEDGDSANTFHAFNPTQVFLYLKKQLLFTRCGARANMLAITLLCKGYFLKYIEIIFFVFEN
jgi:hypothetical protein